MQDYLSRIYAASDNLFIQMLTDDSSTLYPQED